MSDALQSLPQSATENILDQLKNPEGHDVLATVFGAIGPCFTGPIWEELLYRLAVRRSGVDGRGLGLGLGV